MSERTEALYKSMGHAFGTIMFGAIGGFIGYVITPWVGGLLGSFVALTYIFMTVQGQLS
ncbi:hypothetical protein EGH21_06075 [Halomicroarcula sp. F13]|uniref:Major facilitator superfamily (MFS) profile domain-containing protein n=1 Tax=Haloarcula rubra TaxID=2487747 RepID=A0AAW4PND7_9EURY|nr:hypothetical protein [Halomicroarcula rubra]MBX0322592.1 hypothetical protein [Halomicroarcula rubra]